MFTCTPLWRHIHFIVCVYLRVTEQGRISPAPACTSLATQNPPQTSIGCKRRLQAWPSATIQRSLLWMSWPEVQLTSDNEWQAVCVCFRFWGKWIKANHLLRFGSYLVSKDLKLRCDLRYLTVAYHGTRVTKERKNWMRLCTVINYCQEFEFFLKQSRINVTNSAYLVRVEITTE